MTRPPDDVEVCIVAYANEATLVQCIESIAHIDTPVRVALCDNHPDGGSIVVAEDAARRAGIALRSVRRPDNPGFGVACNELAAGSSATWLLFLNPDASVESWAGVEGRRPGITGARTLQSDGRPQRNYGRHRSIWDEITRRLQIPPKSPAGSGYVSGAALLIRRNDFDQIDGFDDRFFMYYEDIDLCRRIVEAGGEVHLDDAFVVRHVGAHSASSEPATAAMRSYRSAREFHRKWSRSAVAFDLLTVVDGLVRVALARLGIKVSGAVGAQATWRAAWSNLRTGGRQP